MIGFTLMGGATRASGSEDQEQSGGGVWSAGPSVLISNCVLTANMAFHSGGGGHYGRFEKCLISENISDYRGGGISCGQVIDSTLNYNRSYAFGGGAFNSVLLRSMLSNNLAQGPGGEGGGVYGGALTNSIVSGNDAVWGGGVYSAVLADCLIVSNSASGAGGISGSTAIDCTLVGNDASQEGGGAMSSTLTSCTIVGNRSGRGGGVDGGTAVRCVIRNNQAFSTGGGAYEATLINSILEGNDSSSIGGGAYSSRLIGSFLTGNHATLSGGGASGCYLTNCTVIANSAGRGGGVDSSVARNSIIYYNEAPIAPNHDAVNLAYCCTVPMPKQGVGNIKLEPQLASASHLSISSPCRQAGAPMLDGGSDIDGEAWNVPPSMGCDEVNPGASFGPLSVHIEIPYTNVAAGFSAPVIGRIDGWTSASRWEFDDNTVLSNRPFAEHSWAAPGPHRVILRAFNQTYPSGVSATAQVYVVTAAIHYVNAANPTPNWPFTSLPTAAQNIQDAVDAASAAGALILVGDGIYDHGGRQAAPGSLTNRVAVTKPLKLQSLNGPGKTIIVGKQVPLTEAVRCAYLVSGSSLVGFTLRDGGTLVSSQPFFDDSGAGVWCTSSSVIVSNCVLLNNQARDKGGGAYSGTLLDCVLAFNGSWTGGGGAIGSVMSHCQLLTNSVNWGSPQEGGAALDSILDQCRLIGNDADNGGGAFASDLVACYLLANGADHGGGAHSSALEGCILSGNGAAHGGVAYNSVLNRCVVTNNSSYLFGGGTMESTVRNSLLRSNGSGVGGGAYGGALYHCTVVNNHASDSGGGAYASRITNSIVYYNTASSFTNASGGMAYCCTTPLPSSGVGNFTNPPLFVSLASGNFRLQSQSPCFDTGNSLLTTDLLDLDGRPRLNGNSVDMGAYEVQSGASGAFIGWLEDYGLPIDGSFDVADEDGDGLSNWQEWVAGTNPTNSWSVLRILSSTHSPGGVTISWSSQTGRSYSLERSAKVGAGGGFSLIQSNITGLSPVTSVTDTNVANAGAFYRIRLQP